MRLVQLFNIPRSSGSLVEDNEVVSDGYTHDDLTRITVEKMQKLLDTDEKDFFRLFQSVVDTLSAPVEPAIPVEQPHPLKALGMMIPYQGEIPKDFTLNIGGKDYVLVEKTERLGIVKSEDLKKVIGDDKPKKKRGRPRKK